MEIKVAKTAGFCYGVQRAVDTVYNAVEESKNENKADKAGRIYTYGPIVHNDIVVNDLRNKGVGIIEDEDSLRRMLDDGSLQNSTIIIRAHGVGKNIYDLINSSKDNIKLLDATCPYVKKIHELVRDAYQKGERIVITGSRSHPEVIGILGQINNDAITVENINEAEAVILPENEPVCLVSQTTFNLEKFEDIVAIFQKKRYDIRVLNTICNATKQRQIEARSLAKESDIMIVIGGKNSSNTAKLYDICKSECKNTYYVQSKEDLSIEADSVRCVGITAGASTPKTIIEEVLNYVRHEFWRF